MYSTLISVSQSLGHSIVSATIVFSFIFIMKIIVDKIVSSHYVADKEIITGNIAISLRRSGLYIGTAIALFSTIDSWYIQIIDGAAIIIFMLLAMFVSEVIIFPKFDNIIALKDNNKSIGFAEAGLFIATGIIAAGSFSGEGPWISSIVFFILGQLILIGAININEYLNKGTITAIQNGNISAGLIVGGLAIAYALILKATIAGPFHGWIQDISSFFVSVFFGGILLLLFSNKIIERLFFSERSIKKDVLDDNYAVISVVVAIKIAIAITISGVVF